MTSISSPVSQLCTQEQIDHPIYREWCETWKHSPIYHRKQWEFVYICQVLKQHGSLERGKRGIGFGVGREPLSAIFATYGIDVLATDAPNGSSSAWGRTEQYAAGMKELLWPEICSAELLAEQVRFMSVDMNNIPKNLRQGEYDFAWSACSLDHLGTLQAGLDFIYQSLKCVKPGGIGVYTTEYNMSSNVDTITHGPTVIYRRKDLEVFADILRNVGYDPAPFDFDTGDLPHDSYIDKPPYQQTPHLRMYYRNIATTSVGLYVRVPVE
jgi:hypothetical protein